MLSQPGPFQPSPSLCLACVLLDRGPTTITGAQDIIEKLCSPKTEHEYSPVNLPRMPYAISEWQMLSFAPLLQVLPRAIQRLSQVTKGFDSICLLSREWKTRTGLCYPNFKQKLHKSVLILPAVVTILYSTQPFLYYRFIVHLFLYTLLWKKHTE